MQHNSLSDYNFSLPNELIAQAPCTPRDASRLMLIRRDKQSIEELRFRDLTDLMQAGDSLVFNDTKVIPARLYGHRPTGGAVEVLLVRPLGDGRWSALAKPGKKLKAGSRVLFGEDFFCDVEATEPDGSKVVRFSAEGDFDALLDRYGQIPLPPYMTREADKQLDGERYQTVYARHAGAAAAPTAGLHFTDEMLAHIKEKGITSTHITLHTGIGTFRPVQTENIHDHVMHTEQYHITDAAANELNHRNPDRLQICVGTTTCRTLESACDSQGHIQPGWGDTSIFIYPGYRFRYMKALLTNFHVPGSSLLMLTCAFGGYDLIMEAYARAVREKYRFFSYGDAMLIL
jgi:S-adenosylmethionine:tRNA ribosyltransferase-isomerase